MVGVMSKTGSDTLVLSLHGSYLLRNRTTFACLPFCSWLRQSLTQHQTCIVVSFPVSVAMATHKSACRKPWLECLVSGSQIQWWDKLEPHLATLSHHTTRERIKVSTTAFTPSWVHKNIHGCTTVVSSTDLSKCHCCVLLPPISSFSHIDCTYLLRSYKDTGFLHSDINTDRSSYHSLVVFFME